MKIELTREEYDYLEQFLSNKERNPNKLEIQTFYTKPQKIKVILGQHIFPYKFEVQNGTGDSQTYLIIDENDALELRNEIADNMISYFIDDEHPTRTVDVIEDLIDKLAGE